MSDPVTIASVRERARRVFDRKAPSWAAEGNQDATLNIPLHPPTERAALSDLSAARAWVETWERAESRFTVEIHWASRAWSRVGTQRVPERVIARGPEAIAHLAHRGAQWRALNERISSLRALTGADAEAVAVLRAQARSVADLDEADFSRLLDVLQWLRSNPDSGSLVRELPIRGIDTKWIERRRGLVESLHRVTTGRTDLGLRAPSPLIRMRALDPAFALGGLRDVSVPVEDLAALHLAPERIFVFENLNTVLAMPDFPGAVVLDGGGHRIDLVPQIPWVREVTYWGDLDSHGFAILHRLRTYGVHTTSVLMDRDTLTAHRDLCGTDPTPNTGVFDQLTGEEQATLSLLSAGGNLRLEQERIPWEYALTRLR